MKKVIWLMLGLSGALCLAGCGAQGGDQASGGHTHILTSVFEHEATCGEEGNIAHWKCDCGALFSDAAGTNQVTAESILIAKGAHTISHVPESAATCEYTGNLEYWTCTTCWKNYLDEECTQEVSISQVILPIGHNMMHHEEIPVQGKEPGSIEYWTCSHCEGFFADASGTEEIEEDDIIVYSALAIPDFIVDVPVGRDPVVLQISDTQIIDAGQTRPGREGVWKDLWATDQIEERCYDYLTELFTATKPDFIILTGDVVYGEFDDAGTALVSFINFMDSFQIPWSPVFGNHDNESKKGVDWQCEQFENSKYCYFEQKELTGNGNYSVGIAQDGKLKRVFYMMDTNGCSGMSAESKANGHTTATVGFAQDQFTWATSQIKEIKAIDKNVKISFAYHIQQYAFEDAYAKYGFDQTTTNQNINIDLLDNAAEGDFGYIGKQMKYPWDEDRSMYKTMKRLGVDSIFVGHEHRNSSSVVYEGIRFQYSQKSSEYDRFNWISMDGKIEGGYSKPADKKSLVGGTVIVVSEDDGSLGDVYIYYCGFENGEIDWNAYKPVNVNGLQYGTQNEAGMWGDANVTASSYRFDETTNAYKIVTAGQGKIYVNTALLAGKSTVTFSVYVPSGSTILNDWGAFALRFKVSEDNGAIAQLPGSYNDATNKYYQIYSETKSTAVKLVADTWNTFTVDISGFADVCTEFAFLVAKNNTIYLKDVVIV